MTDTLFLILGFFFIFISIILTFFRLRYIKLTIEDYARWRKLESKFNLLKSKFLKLIKLSENEFRYIISNFLEKTLMRIKIEALKIETWAAKKLEGLKRNNNSDLV
jgi:hypothetical protein